MWWDELMGITRGLSYFTVVGALLAMAGCGSDLPLKVTSTAGASLPVAVPVPACGAQLPLDAPQLMAAEAKTAVGTAVPICEVTNTGAGPETYRPSTLSAAQTRESQRMNWNPFDGGALPPGCMLSLQKQLFAQINGTWYEARNVGCGSDLPATAS
jgi:hypothetical protein